MNILWTLLDLDTTFSNTLNVRCLMAEVTVSGVTKTGRCVHYLEFLLHFPDAFSPRLIRCYLFRQLKVDLERFQPSLQGKPKQS